MGFIHWQGGPRRAEGINGMRLEVGPVPSASRVPTIHVTFLGILTCEDMRQADCSPLPTHIYYPLCKRCFCPYVSLSPHCCIVFQFPINYQQCAGIVQKAHQKRFTIPSPRLPAPGLQLSCRHPRCPSAATSRTRSVPKLR